MIDWKVFPQRLGEMFCMNNAEQNLTNGRNYLRAETILPIMGGAQA